MRPGSEKPSALKLGSAGQETACETVPEKRDCGELIPGGHVTLTAEDELRDCQLDDSTRFAGLSIAALGDRASLAYT